MTINTLQTAEKWSVQASNLRPPVNVSPAPPGETPRSPTTNPSKSRLSPRKDGETAHPIDNQTAIRVSQLSHGPKAVSVTPVSVIRSQREQK